jgi:hypothetical protein
VVDLYFVLMRILYVMTHIQCVIVLLWCFCMLIASIRLYFDLTCPVSMYLIDGMNKECKWEQLRCSDTHEGGEADSMKKIWFQYPLQKTVAQFPGPLGPPVLQDAQKKCRITWTTSVDYVHFCPHRIRNFSHLISCTRNFYSFNTLDAVFVANFRG